MKVVFISTPTVFGFLIKLWTWSKWSHCEFVYEEHTKERKQMVFGATVQHGVRVDTLENLIKGKQLGKDYTIIDTDLIDSNMAYELMRTEMGAKYDWIGILFSHVFPFKQEHPSKWFCSEIIARCLKKGTTKAPHLISPGRLYDILTK